MRPLLAFAGVLLIGAGAAWGGGAETQAGDPARWDGVLRGLQSTSFAERAQAQQSLDAATRNDLEVLHGLAKAATDAEVRGRLENRIADLELEIWEHPGAVTLDVKNAGAKELSAALSAATGIQWASLDQGPVGGPWTLQAKAQPLWEVFRQLEKQAPAHIQYVDERLVLVPGPMMPGGIGPIDGEWTDVAVGDFLFYAGIGHTNMPVGLFGPGQVAGPRVKVEYGLRGDPRMRMVRAAIPEILQVTDEKGNVLYSARPRAKPNWLPGLPQPMPEVNTGLGFPVAAGMGKVLTIDGQMSVRWATGVQRGEIARLTQQAGDPVTLGGRKWKMWAVAPSTPDGANPPDRSSPAAWDRALRTGQAWAINVQAPDAAGGTPMTSVPTWIKVLDANGKVVWDGVVEAGTSLRVYPGLVKEPLRAELVAATGTREEVVHFEFKDVPVPPVNGAGRALP